jgi:hypothetical protein
MPYVEPEVRIRLDKGIVPESAGELNYLITKLLDDYLRRKGGIRYERLNEVVGVLECVKLEFYRRIAAPYEDGKKDENGDVYSLFT